MRYSTMLATLFSVAVTSVAAVPTFYGDADGLVARSDHPSTSLILRHFEARDDYRELVVRDVLESLYVRDLNRNLQTRAGAEEEPGEPSRRMRYLSFNVPALFCDPLTTTVVSIQRTRRSSSSWDSEEKRCALKDISGAERWGEEEINGSGSGKDADLGGKGSS
ncbi:hypothetical protein EIP91_009614 [Steccherinum ochraceum]|uniref:Uncharacterized protein n=1 Tax=Steccherinum ochraceum TaxID=92696 RepID=A0A4R0R1G8_9APHY|nr:hypothetical protein EIP91_009614 [Steccherinum ochraceum]